MAARPEKNVGNAEQANQRDDEPVERFDDGGRDETSPSEPIRGNASAARTSSTDVRTGKRSTLVIAVRRTYRLIS
jgi:hypothetical protein